MASDEIQRLRLYVVSVQCPRWRALALAEELEVAEIGGVEKFASAADGVVRFLFLRFFNPEPYWDEKINSNLHFTGSKQMSQENGSNRHIVGFARGVLEKRSHHHDVDTAMQLGLGS